MVAELSVGDIVTRDGSDEHLIYGCDFEGLLIDVVCIKEPNCKWISLGETEGNMSSRYNFVRKSLSIEDELRGCGRNDLIPRVIKK